MADAVDSKEAAPNEILLKEPEIIFCQQTFLTVSNEDAILTFMSGGVGVGRFAFTHPHLKRLSIVIERQLKMIEEKYGKIDANTKEDNSAKA
jgi:hypothetical protein